MSVVVSVKGELSHIYIYLHWYPAFLFSLEKTKVLNKYSTNKAIRLTKAAQFFFPCPEASWPQMVPERGRARWQPRREANRANESTLLLLTFWRVWVLSLYISQEVACLESYHNYLWTGLCWHLLSSCMVKRWSYVDTGLSPIQGSITAGEGTGWAKQLDAEMMFSSLSLYFVKLSFTCKKVGGGGGGVLNFSHGTNYSPM